MGLSSVAEDSDAEAYSAARGLGDPWRQSVPISKFQKAPALDVLRRGDGSGLPKPARHWVVGLSAGRCSVSRGCWKSTSPLPSGTDVHFRAKCTSLPRYKLLSI